jgi:hypothetical protein
MKAMVLLHWRLWVVVTVICCQVARYLLLHLVTRLVASLGILYLPSGQLHVGVPHPLLIQLILGPEQHLQADCQLAVESACSAMRIAALSLLATCCLCAGSAGLQKDSWLDHPVQNRLVSRIKTGLLFLFLDDVFLISPIFCIHSSLMLGSWTLIHPPL